jgi:5-carboxymethyl-2-hydroxymuconic-semialdehyde dehydrogenase
MPAFAEVMSAPVMCVTPFDTDEEAATLARAVAGEAPAYLWTADQDRAERVALAIDAPLTWINAHNPADQRTQAEETATRDAVDFYTRPTPVRTGPDDAPVSL